MTREGNDSNRRMYVHGGGGDVMGSTVEMMTGSGEEMFGHLLVPPTVGV